MVEGTQEERPVPTCGCPDGHRGLHMGSNHREADHLDDAPIGVWDVTHLEGVSMRVGKRVEDVTDDELADWRAIYAAWKEQEEARVRKFESSSDVVDPSVLDLY